MADLKKEPYESINPNGRVPAIEDPNTGVTIFESGAIVEYLIENYDKNNILNYTTSPEKYQLKSWLHFQMSGQGPYFGQFAWFNFFHPEKIPSAIERYTKEIKRVIGVLDRQLKQNKGHLVGDKVTYADLAFIMWNNVVFGPLKEEIDAEKNFPDFFAWHQKLISRPAVSKVLETKASLAKH